MTAFAIVSFAPSPMGFFLVMLDTGNAHFVHIFVMSNLESRELSLFLYQDIQGHTQHGDTDEHD